MSAKDKLKAQWEENPVLVMGVGAAVATATTQLLNAISNARNTRTWAKEVNRRVKNN